ncbi:arsenate reductase [Chitinophaga japonensis]|uniref:Arsenate reductase n=2 Tax=Chitinophaga japonensis TaxID=104662 RepID=A0A562TF19_CHIJA|nr:arsenate reductase [Chitinophaga japonensis]
MKVARAGVSLGAIAQYMKRIYHLSTCSTCKKILTEIKAKERGFTLQDIKTEKITPAQLDEMRKLAGSYEALFSRRSQQYRPMGLHEKTLTEDDYRRLILQEYSFLKRPVAVVDGKIYIAKEVLNV